MLKVDKVFKNKHAARPVLPIPGMFSVKETIKMFDRPGKLTVILDPIFDIPHICLKSEEKYFARKRKAVLDLLKKKGITRKSVCNLPHDQQIELQKEIKKIREEE